MGKKIAQSGHSREWVLAVKECMYDIIKRPNIVSDRYSWLHTQHWDLKCC
jgi:hypothetical protein